MKLLFITVAMISFSFIACADDSQPPSGIAALLCKMSQHGQTSTETLSLDYDQKLVNGTPAVFSASMITWTVHNGTETERHELNRLTGTYDYWVENKTSVDPIPTFVCVKTPEKF